MNDTILLQAKKKIKKNLMDFHWKKKKNISHILSYKHVIFFSLGAVSKHVGMPYILDTP